MHTHGLGLCYDASVLPANSLFPVQRMGKKWIRMQVDGSYYYYCLLCIRF
jgi:hypothetical protein